MPGTNTISGEMLREFVEKMENLGAQKSALSDDMKAIMADAKAKGFVPEAIKTIIKMRSMKPSELAEAEALIDTYRHALGMGDDLPLFRHVGLMGVDVAKREEVIDALKHLVPANGSITVETSEGKPVRLTRDKDGNITVQEISVKPQDEGGDWASKHTRSSGAGAKADVPAVDPDAAEVLGAKAFREDTPIVKNPFPFGDPRRARWDKGWRDASGTDGMGPSEDKKNP